MVFVALRRSGRQADDKLPRQKSKASLRSHDDMSTEYIFSEDDLPPPQDPSPDLRELNHSLEALAAVFPNVQPEVFREMLSSFDGESRLALVADALLKNHIGWVKGRWRAMNSDGSQRQASAMSALSGMEQTVLPSTDVFRSEEYKDAVKSLAAQEFKGLSRSTINAVLAESNFTYLEARRTLIHLSSKSWRFTISSLFTRRKALSTAEAEKHPLIAWRSAGGAAVVPCIKQTGNAGLDRELFEQLVLPLLRRAKEAQEQADHAFAVSLNNQEAEDEDASYECACCFTNAPFEEFTSCNGDSHLVCFRCVQHSISEAVFGQGWQRSIHTETGTLRCPAVARVDCTGNIASDLIRQAINAMENSKGPELLRKFDERLADASLVTSKLPLIRCPFCDYAEVDEIYTPPGEEHLRVHVHNVYNGIFLLLCVGAVPFLLPFILLSAFVTVLLSSQRTVGDYLTAQFQLALSRARRRRRGLKFSCQSPRCGATSCMSCQKAWVDIHICHESTLVALRTQVEQAMSMAIKRVCPRCNTSFVKTAGCNKLTCPCGYKMCYVCRRDIGGTGDGPDVGYRHFCEHFRPDGDPASRCTQCSKCNLWEAEDEDAVLREAKEEAESKWEKEEKRGLSDAEKAFLESGIAATSPKKSNKLKGLGKIRWPTVADCCDFIVENFIM